MVPLRLTREKDAHPRLSPVEIRPLPNPDFLLVLGTECILVFKFSSTARVKYECKKESSSTKQAEIIYSAFTSLICEKITRNNI